MLFNYFCLVLRCLFEHWMSKCGFYHMLLLGALYLHMTENHIYLSYLMIMKIFLLLLCECRTAVFDLYLFINRHYYSILNPLVSFESVKHYLKGELYQWPKMSMIPQYIFVELCKIFEVNIRWMIISDLMKPSYGLFSPTSTDTRAYDCVIRKKRLASCLWRKLSPPFHWVFC